MFFYKKVGGTLVFLSFIEGALAFSDRVIIWIPFHLGFGSFVRSHLAEGLEVLQGAEASLEVLDRSSFLFSFFFSFLLLIFCFFLLFCLIRNGPLKARFV